MWKILFEYADGSKCTVSNRHKDIPLRLAKKYHSLYGIHEVKEVYQQYPKKDHQPIDLKEKMKRLQESEV